MKCLITGGSGFLGSHVADELTKMGFEVTIFDKALSKWKKNNQKMVIGNLLEYKKLEKSIKEKDFVFHFAGLSDIEKAFNQPIKTIEYNILGTAYVLELCRKYKIKRFIQASTIYVNSKQGGFYRSSKKAAEDYIEEYQKRFGLNYTILRFGSLYGERSQKGNGVREIIYNALKTNKVSYDGTNKTVREYVHVLDAAKATTDILKKKYKNKHIIITGKRKIKIKYALKKLAKILKIKSKIKFKNEQKAGHYVLSPYTFIPKKGKKYNIILEKNFEESLKNLADEMKKNRRI